MKKTELLIPVGNKECLYAAINNGADAVYLAGKKFGARAYAENFDNEELINAIKLCHLYNVKIYVTVNTMIYNNEINEIIEYLKFLYINNVDAVIMQDNGLIELTRQTIPNLEIHVSTQAHNHNEPAINHYKDIGCTRVVFDRESSLESINNIKTQIEKEVFVYGALCICYSGNCLFSALNGGRSANRGMCVGSCRLPYKLIKNNKEVDSGYLLSTKDLNTLNYLKEILDSNIDSLKIEGRMKSKEYVAAVTKTYRKLIDKYYNNEEMKLSEKEIKDLYQTYNREFTKGYLFNEESIINNKSSNHQGIIIGEVIGVNNKKIKIKLKETLNQEDAIRFDNTDTGMYVNTLYNSKGLLTNKVEKNEICEVDNKERIMYDKLIGSKVLKTIDKNLNKELNNIEPKKIEVSFNIKAILNNQIELEIVENNNSYKTSGNVVELAQKQPITEENIKEQLSKLGNTPFKIKKINIEMDNNIFINLKELNILRRECVEKLIELREGKPKSNIELEIKQIPNQISTKTKISILVRKEDQLQIALRNNIDYIYVTKEELYNKYKQNNNVYLRLDRVIEKHKEYQNERLLCTEFGSIIKYNTNNKIRSDYYLNVANDYTIKKFKNLNVEGVTLSIENDLDKLKEIKNKEISELIIYGTPECMIIKGNIYNIENEDTYLLDKNNNKYKIIYENGFTHIFNSKELNLIEKLKSLKGYGTFRIELLNENIAQVQKIINEIKNNML